MGLDIYLQRRLPEELWVTYGDGDYAYTETSETIGMPSLKHPDNINQIGYFRSSYNDAGFNQVVGNAIGHDYYTIFDKRDDEYEFQPDWEASLKRAKEALVALQAANQEGIRVMEVDLFGWDHETVTVRNGVGALKAYREELERQKEHKYPFTGGYSNLSGYYFPDGRQKNILAMIKGRDCLGGPALYIVYQEKGSLTSYVESLEIVIETIEYVLSQPDPNEYFFNWSG